MATAAYNDVLSKIVNLLPTGAQTQITASDHRQVEVALLEFAEKQWLEGDIKEIDCNDAYIQNNFIMTGPNWGKGINEREGWAICNGNNGTKNRTGRVSIGFGLNGADLNGQDISQPIITNPNGTPVTFGNYQHILTKIEMPSHKHGVYMSHEHGGDKDSIGYIATDNSAPIRFHSEDESSGQTSPGPSTLEGVGNPLTTSGGGQPHNNLQPSIVTLFIQKIPTP